MLRELSQPRESTEAGAVPFVIPSGFMYDSSENADPSIGEVSISLERRDGTDWVIVTPDQAWLSDPTRVFPVIIDPTMEPVESSGDTYVGQDVTTSQADANWLSAGSKDGVNKRRSLFRFPSLDQYHGLDVTDVEFSLWQNYAEDCGSHPAHVQRITSGWNTTVEWGGQPSYASNVVAASNQSKGANCASGGGRITFSDDHSDAAGDGGVSLTGLFKDWTQSGTAQQYPNQGLVVRVPSTGELNVNNFKRFDSLETSHKPRLDVYHDAPPQVPTGFDPVSNSQLSESKPTISALYQTNADETGDWGFVRFTLVQKQAGGSYAQVATGEGPAGNDGDRSSWNIANPNGSGTHGSGTTVTWGLGSRGDLPDGTYRWQAQGDDAPGNGEETASDSPWSGWQYFTINTPAQKPTYLYPVSGSATNQANPVLSALYNDRTAADDGYLTFELFSGATSIASGRAPEASEIAPGTEAEWQVPDLDSSVPGVQGLSAGSYSWKVFSCDGINACVASAAIGLTVDNQVAAPEITSAPELSGTASEVSWAFQGDAGAEFECQLSYEGQALEDFVACESPYTYELITGPKGAYEFAVHQTLGGVTSPKAHGSYVFVDDCVDCPATELSSDLTPPTVDLQAGLTDLPVADVSGFSDLGGTAMIDPDGAGREEFAYEGIDPINNLLLGIHYSEGAVFHPAGSVVRAATLRSDAAEVSEELGAMMELETEPYTIVANSPDDPVPAHLQNGDVFSRNRNFAGPGSVDQDLQKDVADYRESDVDNILFYLRFDLQHIKVPQSALGKGWPSKDYHPADASVYRRFFVDPGERYTFNSDIRLAQLNGGKAFHAKIKLHVFGKTASGDRRLLFECIGKVMSATKAPDFTEVDLGSQYPFKDEGHGSNEPDHLNANHECVIPLEDDDKHGNMFEPVEMHMHIRGTKKVYETDANPKTPPSTYASGAVHIVGFRFKRVA